jgi:hypothetical protein
MKVAERSATTWSRTPAARLHALLKRRTVGDGVQAGGAASAGVGEFRGHAAVMAARPQAVPEHIGIAQAAPSIPPKTRTVVSISRFITLLPLPAISWSQRPVGFPGRPVQKRPLQIGKPDWRAGAARSEVPGVVGKPRRSGLVLAGDSVFYNPLDSAGRPRTVASAVGEHTGTQGHGETAGRHRLR